MVMQGMNWAVQLAIYLSEGCAPAQGIRHLQHDAVQANCWNQHVRICLTTAPHTTACVVKDVDTYAVFHTAKVSQPAQPAPARSP
jgi:hypothetical protein